MSLPLEIENAFKGLRLAARQLRQTPAAAKNRALESLARRLLAGAPEVLDANKKDLSALPIDTSSAFRDRLTLSPARLEAMAESLRQIATLPDPIGELVSERTLANGLKLRQIRAPLGVIFMIFESRPNVITEAFSLAFKSGNAIALRGGSDSRFTAEVIYGFIEDALREAELPTTFMYGLRDYDRAHVAELLKRPDWIDVAVPRGGEKLVEFVARTALMSVLKHDRGLCHAYVDAGADLEMAVNVVTNAKMQRPGVCNALETLLVHDSVANEFLPKLAAATPGLEWRCDAASLKILHGHASHTIAARPEDWDTEHLDLILNCAIVPSLDAALAHIDQHGSRHSETILTKSESNARRFQNDIDAAVVYWNASTRFTDGFEFGLGGEMGISTQKLHVRGPVGLRELTTARWVGDGTGQVR